MNNHTNETSNNDREYKILRNGNMLDKASPHDIVTFEDAFLALCPPHPFVDKNPYFTDIYSTEAYIIDADTGEIYAQATDYVEAPSSKESYYQNHPQDEAPETMTMIEALILTDASPVSWDYFLSTNQ